MQSFYFKGMNVNPIVSDETERSKEWRKRNEISLRRFQFLLPRSPHMTSQSQTYLLWIVLIGSEISSHGSQSQISIEQYESDDQQSLSGDRAQGPGAGTTLKLSSNTISQYLRPFKSQLADLSHLVEFTELAPYITMPTSAQTSSRDSPSTNSSANGGEDDSPPPAKRSRVDHSANVQYPPTKAQSKTLDQFRAAHTLVFTSLPSADWIIKLIAISVLISEPFFGKVLFPNVKNVVFSSAMQERSLMDRYDHLGSFACPHPITFALDWLVYDFSLCIHSTTLAFRTQWIDSHVKSDDSYGSFEEKVQIYERHWMTLNPLAGTVFIEKSHRLKSISYHNILPGDRLLFSGNMDTYLYFGRHEMANQRAVDITLKSIAKPISHASTEPQAPFRGELHTIGIEYLGFPNRTKPGPKVMAHQLARRSETLKRTLRHVMAVIEVDGRILDDMVGKKLWAMLRDGANEDTYAAFCYTCGNCCEEFSCSESLHFNRLM
jgi:hypothetical protein